MTDPIEIFHVYPVNDLEEHDLTTKEVETVIIDGDVSPLVIPNCKCMPRIEYSANGNAIVIHSSFDGREAMEEAEEILNQIKPNNE